MASVDDIDELIATRRLNGVDDGLFNENDKNVVNMTEEAFNEIIDNLEVVAYLTEYGRRGIKENVKKLQARIKDLEKENKNKDTYIKMAKEVIENSIIKQKVKALKESVILDNTIVGGIRNCKTLEYGIKLGKVKACEELLKQEETDEKI